MFRVDGVGTCWTESKDYLRGWIGCRAPLKQPSFVARVDAPASTCKPGPGDDPDLHVSLYSWMVSDDSDPADFGITPVRYFDLYFQEPYSRWDSPRVGFSPTRRKEPLGVCAGTPFTIARTEILQHTRVEMELKGIRLADYRNLH